MATTSFMPYQFAEECLDVTIVRVQIDNNDVDLQSIVGADTRSITLSSFDRWRSASIEVCVKDINAQLADVTFENEVTIDALEVWALSSCSVSRLRRGQRLAWVPEKSAWLGRIGFARNDISGRMDLTAVVVRAKAAVAHATKAWLPNERVADSPCWSVYVDDKAPMPGGSIAGEWKDFSIEDSLKQYGDCAWLLDLKDIDRPRLLLNEGIPGLKKALDIAAKTGRAARVRDALIHSILQPVLVEMALSILNSKDDPWELDSLPGWQQSLLRVLAAKNPTASEELVIEKWRDFWSGSEPGLVVEQVSTAVQRHLQMPQAAAALVKELEKDGDG